MTAAHESPVGDHQRTALQHRAHAVRPADRIEIVRIVADGERIEHDQIRNGAGDDAAAVGDPEGVGGQRRHAADRLRERQQPAFAHVPAQDPRERAEGARMRSAAGSRRRAVGADRRVRVGENALDVAFVHQEGDHPHLELFFEQHVH